MTKGTVTERHHAPSRCNVPSRDAAIHALLASHRKTATGSLTEPVATLRGPSASRGSGGRRRVKIVHTSVESEGKIDIPGVNRLFLVACVALVLVIRESSALALAYCIAATGTMLITSTLLDAVTAWWGGPAGGGSRWPRSSSCSTSRSAVPTS